MTDLRTAAKAALWAFQCHVEMTWPTDRSTAAIAALRAALAQQAEPVEPVGPVAKVELMLTGGNAGLATRIVEIEDHLRERLRPGQLLYPAPPQRKPQTIDEAMQQPRAMAQAYEAGYKAGEANEREACAKACEHQPHWGACAAAIRARGTP